MNDVGVTFQLGGCRSPMGVLIPLWSKQRPDCSLKRSACQIVIASVSSVGVEHFALGFMFINLDTSYLHFLGP